jgi:hypothetical protein
VDRHVVASFLYPFRRGGRATRWLVGTACVVLLPAAFPLLFGYAVGCVRASACDPAASPPRWRVSRRLVADGVWSATQAALLTAPFAAVAWTMARALGRAWHPTGSAFPDVPLTWVVALAAAALPWGVLLLVVVPPTLAAFATTGRVLDLADVRLVTRCVTARYTEWNLVVAGITTAWAVGMVGLALLAVGVVPGVFYAILVSAHACASLAPHRTPG